MQERKKEREEKEKRRALVILLRVVRAEDASHKPTCPCGQ